MTMEKEEERQEEEEEEDTAMDMEEPCFNLLGSGACVFAAPVVENVVENPCATDETKSRYESDEVDVDVEVSSPPRYPGFIPASKVHIEEPKIEEKLASAGLDLSDSEDEGYKPKLLSRQNDEKDESWEDKWEIPDAHFVDLASSPLERQPSYTIEDDLDNPYADLSQYNAFDAPNEVADADPDYVDDISDNEPTMSLTSPRPLTVRSELKEFEHFVCMEDLRGDYGCRINYKKMFAGQRKSYADRLATRQAESRKRKRNAARNNAGGASTSTKRGGKASKSGKKRKATAAPRRDRAKAPRSKRARKTGASARRTSSATTFSPGINHYDDSAADLGEDLNTMSWEGIDRAEATMTTLEEAKAFLKKESPDGTNLYDHLGDVLLKIIVERPENLHETFENISTLVKQQRYLAPPQPPTADGDSQLSSIKKQAQTHQENWCNVALELLKLKSEDEAPSEPATGVADLLDEANMFEWAGLGFSKGETFRLSLALQRLAQTNGTVNMRFWGKILGSGADYYVAEGELSTAYEPEDLEAEEGATGANKLTYWAMKDNGAYQWVQLPPVRCDQILAARQLHRYVRGDLEAPVLGHPPFPGLEKNYLRAQIARISAGTVLCPAGYFEVNEEGDIAPAEEPEIKATADLLDLGSWTHFTKEINARYGRMTPMPPLTNADGEEEPREGEEFAPPLRALSEDKPLSWRVDRQPAMIQPSVGEVAIVRSLVWPGAVSIAVGKKFLNVYVGHGVKFLSEPFQLAPPQRLQVGSCVGLSEDNAEGDGKPTLRCEIPVEQPDLLEDPSPPAEEEE
ncbi:hypothetical protein JG687_00006312 [Phytophthora cactorum]|uniref:Radial spokehead-like protein n=1 Tax=Phytophthora cactorum TaxID=29920 RepID=A0A8T1UN98_9STRA|nr:hypothetical protein JG687_00006312 [Phytophthora cactorum]